MRARWRAVSKVFWLRSIRNAKVAPDRFVSSVSAFHRPPRSGGHEREAQLTAKWTRASAYFLSRMPFSIPSSVSGWPATVHLRPVQKSLTDVRTEYFAAPGLRVSSTCWRVRALYALIQKAICSDLVSPGFAFSSDLTYASSVLRSLRTAP